MTTNNPASPAVATAPVAVSADREAISKLVAAYHQVVLPAVSAGLAPLGNCFAMSAAGAEVLRRLGVPASAEAVEVFFTDYRNEVIGVPDDTEVRAAGYTARRSGSSAGLGHGHAVIITDHHLVDLTFGQFDRAGAVGQTLAVSLAGGWNGGLVTHGNSGDWVVRYTSRDETTLRDIEKNLESSDQGGLADLLHTAAVLGASHTTHRHSKIGRNDPCPCASGAKYKRCCAA
jgi:hypothetical protein